MAYEGDTITAAKPIQFQHRAVAVSPVVAAAAWVAWEILPAAYA